MTPTRFLATAALAFAPALIAGQSQNAAVQPPQGGLDPATLVRPLGDSWPTYSGDYTGRRYSSLTQVNQSTVKNLTLAWMSRVTGGPGPVGSAAGGRGTAAAPTIVGGVGTAEYQGAGIKGAILQVDGVLYVSAPDNVWAIDARDGHEIWHFFWKTRGGTHIGSRGLGM